MNIITINLNCLIKNGLHSVVVFCLTKSAAHMQGEYDCPSFWLLHQLHWTSEYNKTVLETEEGGLCIYLLFVLNVTVNDCKYK